MQRFRVCRAVPQEPDGLRGEQALTEDHDTSHEDANQEDVRPEDREPLDLATPEPDGPTRRCIVTRAVRPKEAMLRFVVSPEGVVTPDVESRLPGRGFWLSPSPNVLETARKKGAFQRAARRNVETPKDLASKIDALLENRCAHLIGLARKAGQAVVGFEKVKALVQTGRAAYVIEAFDGAENAHKKLNAEAFGTPVYKTLDREALAGAFGRDNAVHAALTPGGLASRLEVDLVRLGRLRARIALESAVERAPDRKRPREARPKKARRAPARLE